VHTPEHVCNRNFQGPRLGKHPGVGRKPAANGASSAPCPWAPTLGLVIAELEEGFLPQLRTLVLGVYDRLRPFSFSSGGFFLRRFLPSFPLLLSAMIAPSFHAGVAGRSGGEALLRATSLLRF
jgi:hypothetical protein